MTDTQRTSLIVAARRVRRYAYAPYSQFRVGAALLTAAGQIVVGSNVENASYGLTICAERAAVFNAVSAGETQFLAMAVASLGGHALCGACRQVVSEFATHLPILLIDCERPENDDVVVETDIHDLLPVAFSISSITQRTNS